MDVKTLTDSSIQAALAKARDQLGEDVVLVESTPATDDAPARIAVMVDAPAGAGSTAGRRSVPKPSVEEAPPQNAAADQATEVAGGAPDGYGAASTADLPSGNGSTDRIPEGFPEEPLRPGDGTPEDAADTGRGAVFPASSRESADAAEHTASREEMVEARLDLLENRLGGLGAGGGLSARRWVAHPLFATLLDEGMRPKTVKTLFEDLSERGLDPDRSGSEELRWALAQVICHRIQVAVPDRSGAPLALIGPSGAGKTSLLLKLAAHDRVLAGRPPTILHLLPDERPNTAYQNPTALYRRFGLPVQSVRSEDDMATALGRIDHFGQVLIDTPPLPLPLADARARLRRFDRLLRPLRSLDVHFVLNATHALDSIDPEVLPQLPLAPRATALTHLDEARRWGRVAEWLVHIDLPIQFVSTGPSVPEGAQVFSLKWFVEDVMDLR